MPTENTGDCVRPPFTQQWGGVGRYILALWVVVAMAVASFTFIAVVYDGPFIMPVLMTPIFVVPVALVTRETYREHANER